MRKILKTILVIQERKDGKWTNYTKRRLNPYNPLTYFVIIGAIILGVIMFGVVGIKNEMDFKNPFRYQ